MLENYFMDDHGVIHQREYKAKVYDQQYLSYYEGLMDRTIKLGYLRLGWVLGKMQQTPVRLLEIGYGMGTFLEAASLAGIRECYGCDVANYPLPAACESVDWDEALNQSWDLVALFDVLEHLPELEFLVEIRAEHIVVSVPNCRWKELGDDWFKDWRMRLPDEHLHHFDRDSLCKMMKHFGFTPCEVNHIEDGLRLRDGETGPNIITGLFKSSGKRSI